MTRVHVSRQVLPQYVVDKITDLAEGRSIAGATRPDGLSGVRPFKVRHRPAEMTAGGACRNWTGVTRSHALPGVAEGAGPVGVVAEPDQGRRRPAAAVGEGPRHVRRAGKVQSHCRFKSRGAESLSETDMR